MARVNLPRCTGKAANGNEALERIQASPPDFISLDLVMPGVDGYKVLEAIRMVWPKDLGDIAGTGGAEPGFEDAGGGASDGGT